MRKPIAKRFQLLMVAINIEKPGDLIGQVYRQLRAAILEGRLAGGDRVPPTRYLADRLSVSRQTILEAYERLIDVSGITP